MKENIEANKEKDYCPKLCTIILDCPVVFNETVMSFLRDVEKQMHF
jgi:hypothetical protein